MFCSSTSLSSSSSSSSAAWASLPDDLLELLLGSLESFFDRLRFGAVCRSWRHAAAAFGGCLARPPLPILSFREPTKNLLDEGRREGEAEAEAAGEMSAAEDPITRYFYSLSEDKVYRLHAPTESRYCNCLGSSHGWLAMVDLCAKHFLINPITGMRIDLPSLTTLTRVICAVETREEDGATVYMYNDPYKKDEEPYPFTGKQMRDNFVYSLVLSSSPLDPNCIVMAAVWERTLLAYCRPGDDSWFEVETPTGLALRVRDIIYHGHRFYALSNSGETITVDFNHSKPSPADHIPVPLVELFATKRDNPYYNEDAMYLVALPPGEIVLVIRDANHPSDSDSYDTEGFDDSHDTEGFDDSYNTVGFGLYKAEVGDKGIREWVELNYIGDCCLFLGFNQSMSLPPFQVLGKCRTNCIFFTDNLMQAYFGEDYGGLDFGIFDIEEETIEHFCRIDARRVMPPPMWITPSV